MSLGGYEVQKIPGRVGRDFIQQHHYSHGCHNGPMTWGLFANTKLVGVCAFATPNSENVRASVFGPEHKERVTELHRLVILDVTPKNAESFLIARALRGLHDYRPGIWGVLSFADQTEGHLGTIYQATNAIYLGTTASAWFYRDASGRLRHPRQNGVNITPGEAHQRGWTRERRGAKHRYLFLLGDGSAHRRRLRQMLLQVPQPYPKNIDTKVVSH